MKLLLDTNVLIRLCHPTGYRDIQSWFRDLLTRDANAPEILISALADYEVRRALLARSADASLSQFERIAAAARHLPVTPEVARRAADLRARFPVAEYKGLSDADLIMAVQAELEEAVLVTSDHDLATLPNVTAKDWSAVTLEP